MTSRPKTGIYRVAVVSVALAALATACGGASESIEAGTTAPLTTAVPTPAAVATPVAVAAVPAPTVPTTPAPTTAVPKSPPATTAPVVKTTPAPAANAASQSPADAARDGVVPAFAALPLKVRMSVRSSVVAPEGVWVASRPTPEADRSAVGCRIGPEEGQTPADWICTSEYGEVLLLDPARTRILRAYPLAGVPPQFLRLTANALYCGRPGDGGLLPDSMACRIDRTTLAATVRVFPGEPDSVVIQPCFTPPASWRIADHYLPVTDLAADGKGVRVKGADGQWLNLDPLTLEGRQ
jgi:hypothetical protein